MTELIDILEIETKAKNMIIDAEKDCDKIIADARAEIYKLRAAELKTTEEDIKKLKKDRHLKIEEKEKSMKSTLEKYAAELESIPERMKEKYNKNVDKIVNMVIE